MKKSRSIIILAGVVSGLLGLIVPVSDAHSITVRTRGGTSSDCSNNTLEVWGHGPSHKIDRSGLDDDIKINIAGHVRKTLACVSLYETTGCDLYRNKHGRYTKETHVGASEKKVVFYPKSLNINGMRLGC